jgi:hypothetical protein
MEILLLPTIVVFTPLILLLVLLRFFIHEKIGHAAKFLIALAYTTLTVLAAVVAIMISMGGMTNAKVQCLTGVVVFIPLGFIAIIIGLICLFLFKSKNELAK